MPLPRINTSEDKLDHESRCEVEWLNLFIVNWFLSLSLSARALNDLQKKKLVLLLTQWCANHVQ